MAKLMDTRDFDLLKRIKTGQQMFKPQDAGGQDSDEWSAQVERLLRLRTKTLIRMPDPRRYQGTGKREGFAMAGPCELTADGRDAIERHEGKRDAS